MSGVASLLEVVLYVLIALVVVRSLLSWFPIRQDNDLARVLGRATDPLLMPFRRLIPTIGMIDLSGLVLIVLLTMMISAVRRTAEL